MLVSISDRHGDSSVTRPYQFGSNRSRLIRVLLEDGQHRDARAAMSEDEWLKLVAWIDYNANYHSTLIDKSMWKSEETLVRVPVYLPSPWVPADTNPSFLNTVDPRHVPPEYRAGP